jgi:hypothetical protein
MAAFDKTRRLKLPVQRKPHFMTIAPGLALGYRRNDGAGAWVTREAIGGGNSRLQKFATADDLEAADGGTVMDYAQALVHANRMKRRNNESNSNKPITVEEAITAYETELTVRGRSKRSKYNATSVRFHLKDAPLNKKPVTQLTTQALAEVRSGMVKKGLKPATVDRVGKCFKAAMNLAAEHDPHITNSKAWSKGWAMLPNSSVARNIVLSADTVRAIVHKAYEVDHELGVYFHTLAGTGCRESQMLRLQVRDLQDNRADPRLMMPGGMKGKNPKLRYEPVPITAHLADILRVAAAGRSANDVIFDKINHPDPFS